MTSDAKAAGEGTTWVGGNTPTCIGPFDAALSAGQEATGTLVGFSGDSCRYGLSAGAVELTTCICLGIACALLFPYYIRARVYTIPEYLEFPITAPRASYSPGSCPSSAS